MSNILTDNSLLKEALMLLNREKQYTITSRHAYNNEVKFETATGFPYDIGPDEHGGIRLTLKGSSQKGTRYFIIDDAANTITRIDEV